MTATTERDSDSQPDHEKGTSGKASTVGGTVKAWSRSAASRMRTTTRKSLELTEVVASHVGKVALTSTGKAVPPIEEGLDQIQSLYNRGVDTVFPECPTPAFLLPTGPEPDDYLLLFDLNEMLTNLRSGVLARPKIELWAATAEGYDVNRLAEELAVSFVEQFNAARASLVERGIQEVAEYQKEEDAASREMRIELWGPTLSSASFWTLAMGVTPVGLLLLWMGQRPRTEIFGLTAKYLQARSDTAAAKRDLEHEVDALESDFDHKRKAFHRAVRNITIRVHPRLRQVSQSLGGEGDSTGQSAPCQDVPNVEEHLRHPLYRKALTKRRQGSRRSLGFFGRVLGRH